MLGLPSLSPFKHAEAQKTFQKDKFFRLQGEPLQKWVASANFLSTVVHSIQADAEVMMASSQTPCPRLLVCSPVFDPTSLYV